MKAERSTIEAIGVQLAINQEARMHAHDNPSAIHICDADTLSHRHEELTPLIFNNEPVAVFYDKMGDIYTTRWRTRTDFVPTNNPHELELSDINTKNYQILGRQNPRQDLLSNLPQNATVHELLISEIKDDLPGAIRQQMHILANNNREYQQAQALIEYTNQMAIVLITQDLDQAKLDKLREHTFAFFEEQGLSNPINQDKIHATEMLLKTTWHDRLGRLNTPASRFQNRAAFLVAHRRLVVSLMVNEKFSASFEALMFEWDKSLLAISSAHQALDSAYHVLRVDNPAVTKAKEVIRFANHTLLNIKLQPFLSKAREAQLSLVASPNPARDAHIIGTSEYYVENQPNALSLLSNKHPDTKAANKQVSYALYLLENLLTHHATIYPSSL